jgi:hypothetical protein
MKLQNETSTHEQGAGMSSFLRSVDVISREEYADLELDSKVETIRALDPIVRPRTTKKRGAASKVRQHRSDPLVEGSAAETA